MSSDAELMEASLVAIADAGVEIHEGAFRRFFEAYPDRRGTFLNLEAAAVRMTNETIEIMYGLATDEKWVWPLVAELVFTHRSYGRLPWVEYEAWIALTIDEMSALAGKAWTPETDTVWRRQGERLKALISEASDGWDKAMPGHI